MLAKLNPDYSSLSTTAQEEFRCKLHRDCRQQVQQELYNDLFGCHLKTVKPRVDRLFLSNADRKLLDSAQLLVVGIGEDYIVLESMMGWSTSLATECETLFDWALLEHQCWRRGEDPLLFPDEDIYNYGLSDGAILIDQEYSTLQMKSMRTHVAMHLRQVGEKFFHSITPTTDFDAMILKMWKQNWGTEPDTYLAKRSNELEVEFQRAARGVVYRIQERDGLKLVFSDATVLKAIRIRSFLRDVQAVLSDLSELEEVLRREESAAIDYLHWFSLREYVDEPRDRPH